MTNPMELREILHIIWRRASIILLGTVLVAAVAFFASRHMQPVYQAKVTMKVDQPANTPLSERSLMTGEDLALTYSKLLTTRPLLETVIANLGLNASPEELKDHIDTNRIPDTQLVELTVRDTDAQRAAATANAIAFTFITLHNQERQSETITAYEQDVMAQLAKLKELIEHNQSALDEASTSDLPAQEGAAPSLQPSLAAQQSTYAGLLSTYLDIQLAQSQFFDITVIEPAVAPAKPISPRIPINTFLGALLGGSLSLGLVFALHYLDRSLKTRDDVTQILSLPALGVIPRMQGAERSNGPIAASLPRSYVSEAFRVLRTNIRFAGVDRPLTTILLASAEPGAGKTTVAVNLGIVWAQAGYRVVLMDADLRFPRLHEAFGLHNRTGLTDLLVGDLEDDVAYMQETGTDNLRLIASGPVPPNPSELLGSKRMGAVLAAVRRQADFVIVDAPAGLPVTDAAVLAPKVDGVLLVVRAHGTQRDAIRQTAAGLLQVGGRLVGAVLNGVPRPTRGYYGYHYYRREEQALGWWSLKWGNLLAGARHVFQNSRGPAEAPGQDHRLASRRS